MSKIKTFYKSNLLPHWQPFDGIFFVTFRLNDSLPKNFDDQLRTKRDANITKLKNSQPFGYKELIKNEHKKYFKKFDESLDKALYGPDFLKQDKIAKVIIDKLKEYDDSLYNLLAYAIMSNHVHIVLDTRIQVYGLDLDTEVNQNNFVPLSKIMRLIKGGSARTANQLLKRTGKSFWYRDYWDYLIKDDKELFNIIGYVVDNPVAAKLVKHWEDWPYTYWADAKDRWL